MDWEQLATTSEAVCMVALDGRFLRANQQLCRDFGYEESELLQLRVRDVTHPDDRSYSVGIVDSALRHIEQSQEEMKRYLRKDGSVLWGLLRTTLYRDQTGEPTYFISYIQDYSQRMQEDPLARALARRLQRTQEQVRQSLAREIHEETGQLLSVFKAEFSSLRDRLPPDMSARAAHLSQLTDGLLASVRRLWLGLRPSMLDELGLGPAIDWLLEESCKLHGVSYDFATVGKAPTVDAHVRVTVYRICQDGVALLLATPDTRRLHIRLIYEPDQLCLTLNGDGHNEPRRGHPTLLAMEERAALQGGTLTLEDGFKLCIPLGRPSTDRRPVPPHWE